MRFKDRRHAGEALGRLVKSLAPVSPLVIALPRGGVPVGFEVARALGCSLDVLGVQKIGAPGRPELAIGAVAEGGVVIRNQDVTSSLGVQEPKFDAAAAHARRELDQRMASFRSKIPPLTVKDQTAVLIDDGLATGATARAALDAVRSLGAAEAWLAVPVAPRATLARLDEVADKTVAVSSPRSFGAVGAWYRDFTQVSTSEAIDLLVELRS